MIRRTVPTLALALVLLATLPAIGGEAVSAPSPAAPEAVAPGSGCPYSAGADDAAKDCPYLNGRASARGCPYSGDNADAKGCPFAGSEERDARAERPRGEPAAGGCPFLNGEMPAVDPLRERNRA